VKARKNRQISKYAHPLLAATLAANSIISLTLPVFAAGVAADTDISNTATATYEDPDDPTTPINSTSNTVTVKVAEVAGVTVVANSIENKTTPGQVIQGGNEVYVNFTVTNTGNDASKIRIPNKATVNGAGADGDGGFLRVEYETTPGTWVPLSATDNDFRTGSMAPDASIKVRVVLKVDSNANANDNISVSLGETVTPNAQNVARGAANVLDVYTVDNPDSPLVSGEIAGAPANGVREAAATMTVPVGATKQAFVRIKKTRGAVDNNTTPNNLTDDKYTYSLEVDVAGVAPAGSNKLAGDLAGTSINLDSATTNRILISDAIPAGTVLNAKPAAPTGWKVVYSTAPITSTATADSVAWTTWDTTAPTANASGNFNTVTRVGFVLDDATGVITAGSPAVNGFSISVTTTGMANGGKLANVAQVFGTTDADNVSTTGTPDSTKPAIDESGDSQYSNYNADGTPGANDPNTSKPVTNGVPDFTNPNTGNDTNGDNTGTGPLGEPNVLDIVPITQLGVLNGPKNRPDATGSAGNQNDDFTNKSVKVAAGSTQGAIYTSTPDAVTFNNTVKNTGTNVIDISLLPKAPTNTSELPDQTKVTIKFDTQTVVYIWDQTAGKFTPSATAPVKISNVAVSAVSHYEVKVELPITAKVQQAYPVAIVAFVDTLKPDPDSTATPVPNIFNKTPDADEIQNVTIDRVYTGYVRLVKEVQILAANGIDIVSPYTTSPSPTIKPQPGEFLQYRVRYQNISEPVILNSGSVGLNAQNLLVTEDGTSGTNNWALADANGKVRTEHKPGSALDSSANSTIAYTASTGIANNTNIAITKYIVTIPLLEPGTNGEFNFTRKVYLPTPTP
jgi:hypothetical protein